MAAVFSRIANVMRTYPLTRGMASYAVIWPVGSLVQQSIQGRTEFDYGRVARFSLYGCCFVAPTLYTWIKIAGTLFPNPGLRHALYKALLEQVTYTPAAMTCFYFFMTLLEGGTLKEAREEVADKFLPTYKVVLEQMTYGPFAGCSFYVVMTLLEGGTWEDAKEEVRNKFLPTYKTALWYWPVVQLFNFTWIKERNRVPFVSVFSLIWIVFLAYMKERKVEIPEKPSE